MDVGLRFKYFSESRLDCSFMGIGQGCGRDAKTHFESLRRPPPLLSFTTPFAFQQQTRCLRERGLPMAPQHFFDTDQIKDRARKDILYLLEGVSKGSRRSSAYGCS